MAQIFAAYSSNYQVLRISGNGYPAGTYKLTFDSSTDPTEGGAVDWHGPFSARAGQVRQVIIEDDIYLDYANGLFENFSNCTSIRGIEHIHGNLLNTTRMFANTPNLTQPITLENMISINCLDATEMFANSGFSEIVLNNINMKNCTSMKGMFKNAKARVIEMTAIDTNSVRYADDMFKDATNLTNIYGTGGYFDFSQSITSSNMFDNTPLLTNWPNKGLDKFGAISIDAGGYINMSPYSVEFVDIRIREKYDTKANWLNYDPVLFAGELAIESDTNRFKVGDGAHHYSELPYMYGFKIDARTIIEDSESTELSVPIDDDTIYVDSDGKIKAKAQLFADQITIMQSSEGRLFLDLDDTTIRVSDAGELEAVTATDDVTIKKGINGLYVPIDNATLFVDNGLLKARGDVNPGVGLEWNASTARTLDVKLGKTIDEDTNGLEVNYDGRTIYWDEGAGVNGALRGMDVRSADGSVKVTEGGHAWDLSLPLDNDTIKLDNGKIVATAQVPEIDNSTIVFNSNSELSVPIDEDTIYLEGGKLKAKQVEVKVDNETIIVNSEGEFEAVKQMPDIDEKTIQLINDKLAVAIDNDTIIYDSENNWIEIANSLDIEPGDGIEFLDQDDKVIIKAKIDSETMRFGPNGELVAIGDPLPKPYLPDTWLHSNCEGELEWSEPETVPVDEETIIYNPEKDWIEVASLPTEGENGIYFRDTSEVVYIGVNVDGKTLFVNCEGQLEGAPNVKVDDKTIVIDSENVISVNIDNDTIIYNESSDWVEVPNRTLDVENGLYIRDDDSSDTTFIGIKFDSESLYINENGELAGAPNVIVDDKTIKKDENDVISVNIDNDTIIYDEDNDWVKVPNIELITVPPVYIIANSEGSEGAPYIMGVGYDNETIVLNKENELTTAIGGGWVQADPGRLIATGTNVKKNRHHALPDDDADYFLDTIYFPSRLEVGDKIEVSVTHNRQFMSETCELKWNEFLKAWVFDGRHWDSEAHPLDPHGYSIFVYQNETIVRLYEDFEIDPETLTASIRYGEHVKEKSYVDNSFIKVDNKTIVVNSEGALEAKQLEAGKWIQVSEGIVSIGNLCQGLGYNEEKNCIYIKEASTSEVGGIRIDGKTLKTNSEGQLEVDFSGNADRGLDMETGKIGHSNVFEGTSRQAGDPTSIPSIKWDDYGHLTSVESKDIPTYLGASAYSDGVRGLVPEASSSKRKAFLRGDGTWSSLLEAGLFSVIETTGQWYCGTDRRSKVLAAAPNENQVVIAPIGFTVDRDVEGIDTIYATEATIGHQTIVARSNSQAEIVVKCTARWLVMNM